MLRACNASSRVGGRGTCRGLGADLGRFQRAVSLPFPRERHWRNRVPSAPPALFVSLWQNLHSYRTCHAVSNNDARERYQKFQKTRREAAFRRYRYGTSTTLPAFTRWTSTLSGGLLRFASLATCEISHALPIERPDASLSLQTRFYWHP